MNNQGLKKIRQSIRRYRPHEILASWIFTKRPTSVAIDVTHRCNLKCAHCYWWKQEHPSELSDLEMVTFMKGLKATGLGAAILYGGEPTLRPEVCLAASEIFHTTLAFTNGVNGFPPLKNGQWILSLDGTEEINDGIRGKGVYRQALENVRKAERPPIVHMTLSKLNQENLDDFVCEMMALPIKGLGFSFYTPNRGDKASDMFIPLQDRDRLCTGILSLRKRYGEKIGFTPAMARQLMSSGSFTKWNRYSDCPVSRRVRCFKSDGKPKACTYGDDADCSRCGCAAVVAYRGALRPLDYRTLQLLVGLIIPDVRARGEARKCIPLQKVGTRKTSIKKIEPPRR